MAESNYEYPRLRRPEIVTILAQLQIANVTEQDFTNPNPDFISDLYTRVLIHLDILLESLFLSLLFFAPFSILHSWLTFSFSSFSSFCLFRSWWQLQKHEGCQFLRWWSLCSQQPWFLELANTKQLWRRKFLGLRSRCITLLAWHILTTSEMVLATFKITR